MNHKIRSTLLVVCAVIAFFVISFAIFGRSGAAIAITSVIDLPTLFTILIARYARTNLRAAVWTAINVLAFELVHAGVSPTYGGELFGVYLVAQALIAICVRLLFRKKRTEGEGNERRPSTIRRRVIFPVRYAEKQGFIGFRFNLCERRSFQAKGLYIQRLFHIQP